MVTFLMRLFCNNWVRSVCSFVASLTGKGTVTIDALAGNQQAKKTLTGGKAVVLKGAMFTAVFEVQTPAKQPPPGPGSPIPDPMSKYSGQGMFQTTNLIFTGA